LSEEAKFSELREQLRVLRIVAKDLAYIVKELVELEPRVPEQWQTVAALDDHLSSLGGEDDG
jgi:hypothetical protein